MGLDLDRGRGPYDPPMADTYALSKEAFDRLQAELTNLTTHGRTDIARKI